MSITKKIINVTKRDGHLEPLDFEKIHQVLYWATEDLTGVSVSDIEMYSNLQFYDGIPTSMIHDIMIASAADLISEEATNYQFVAARLMNFQLRKQVYGSFEPIHIRDLIIQNIKREVYDSELLGLYSDDEWERLNNYIKHNRDFNLTYGAMKQLIGKYLVQDRTTKVCFETPQMLYMLVSAVLFAKYPPETRLKYVKDYYDAISANFDISLPTPIMAGVRTPERQFSSCVLIECDDTLESIIATTGAVLRYISRKAGIGLGAGRLRAEGSSVDKGRKKHTGVTPFLRLFQSAVKSCCVTPNTWVEVIDEDQGGV